MQSSPASDRDAAAAADDLQAQPDDARAQLAAAEDRFLRARADLENYRRRAERELERRVQERGDALLLAWLDVVDSLERALAVETDAHARDGLQAVLEQMQAVLARQGVIRAG